MERIEYILGPIVVAVLLNVLLYGVCILQFSTYYAAKFADRPVIKMLVVWVFLLDSVHVSASAYLLWHFVVSNFTEISVLTEAPWPFSFTPIMTSLASCPIQVFLAWRIHQFAKSQKLLFSLMGLSLAQLSVGVATAVQAIQRRNINNYRPLVSMVDAWLGLTVVCDIAITMLLWYHLSKSRTGFTHTDGVIMRLIRSSIETAAFGTFFCIMNLVAFTASSSTNFHTIFAFPLGRIYTITLLLTLNSRRDLRSELHNNIYTHAQTIPVFARPVPIPTTNDFGQSLQRSLPIFPQGIQSYRLSHQGEDVIVKECVSVVASTDSASDVISEAKEKEQPT
ncbi:hypothetical protein HGRIS_014505 [Hohenbuehelia grisea]|uniref:DUF6534 domain-containing protein n=1 Tax=Hohenbuehelia grisea TaxID=104357 RepID=A0ABR3JUA0_9AGAR